MRFTHPYVTEVVAEDCVLPPPPPPSTSENNEIAHLCAPSALGLLLRLLSKASDCLFSCLGDFPMMDCSSHFKLRVSRNRLATLIPT